MALPPESNAELEELGAQLRQAAEAADNQTGSVQPPDVVPKVEPAGATEELRKPEGQLPEATSTKPDNSETPSEKADRLRNEKGQFVKQETSAKQAETAAESPQEQPKEQESEYAKAKKERERQETLLRNFQAEKEQTRAQFEAERRQLEQERRQLQAQMQNFRKVSSPSGEPQASAKDYEDAAIQFAVEAGLAKAGGDDERATQMQTLADRARDASKTVRLIEQQIAQKDAETQFQSAYSQEAQKLLQSEPDAGKEGTPLFNA